MRGLDVRHWQSVRWLPLAKLEFELCCLWLVKMIQEEDSFWQGQVERVEVFALASAFPIKDVNLQLQKF